MQYRPVASRRLGGQEASKPYTSNLYKLETQQKERMTIEELPEILLEHALSYLCMADRCHLLGLTRRLWAFKSEYEKRMQTLKICYDEDRPLVSNYHSNVWPQRMYQNFATSLHTLDLSYFCLDWFLQLIAEQSLFPNLKHVSMQASCITDEGLRWLAMHNGSGLETIDITFCKQTSYAGTFVLRNRFRSTLRLLRRQPAWLDGKFHTPFNEDSDEAEVHTYYADGSFSFTRDNQSRGFVLRLVEWDESGDYLADKLQYSNFEPLVGWPTWTTYSYRPGVCLFRLPDNAVEESGEVIRTVLVGQNLRGLRPPRIRHLMEQQASMEIGTSSYFVKDEEGTLVRSETRPASGGIMISRMRVYPLDSVMPPDDLVEECRLACEVMKDLGEDVVDSGENYLNEALSQDL